MLLYHPAFDMFHGIFRLLRILERFGEKAVEVERLRVLDFYLLFPSTLQNFTFPRTMKGVRKTVISTPNRYSLLKDPKRVFARLEPFQECALKTLSAWGVIDSEQLKNGRALRTKIKLPIQLKHLIDKANFEESSLIEFLTGPLSTLDLYGESGLKQRADLFEYRYDPPTTSSRD